MTDLQQAAQQALEALETKGEHHPRVYTAITALREALAQPEQEPDRRVLQAAGTHPAPCARHCEAKAYEIEIRSLNSRLKQAQPKQEPVAWGVFEGNLHDMFFTQEEAQEMAQLKGTHAEVRPLYTTAAQRPWQGLTEEEVQFYIKKHSKLVNAGYDKMTDTNLVAKTFDSTGFYKEVSTVLKERNT